MTPAPASPSVPLVATGVSWRPARRAPALVQDLSLQVRAGEVVGLLGRNGAGKTTTLLLLVGLLRPASGTVRVLGGDPAARDGRRPDVRRRVGWTPAALEGCDHLRVGELVAHHAALLGLSSVEGRRCGTELLDELELAPLANRRVAQLSTGERQRALLVLAELGRPDVLVLDEPTSGLDPFGLALVRRRLAAARARGAAVLLSSHQLGEVERSCDRALFMARGRLVHAVDGAELGRLAEGEAERGRDLETVFREVLR